LDRLPNSGGMLPDNWLLLKFNMLKLNAVLSDRGMPPVSRLLERSKYPASLVLPVPPDAAAQLIVRKV